MRKYKYIAGGYTIMTDLDMNKLVSTTSDDEIKCTLLNIENFKDMDDYTDYTDTSKEDFEFEQACGLTIDITPGVYNEVLDKMDYSELTAGNIYSVLLEEVHEDSFQELLKYLGENNIREARKVRLVTETYNVFTIGKHLYIDYA